MLTNKDFREFIELLNRKGVRYLVVGGYAVAAHGYPRYTKDLDIWIENSEENARMILAVLDEFGFGDFEIDVDDFIEPEHVIQLGLPPNRIDLVTSLTGLDFSECYESRVAFCLGDLGVNLIDVESLKKNKAATARPQDLADLDNLK